MSANIAVPTFLFKTHRHRHFFEVMVAQMSKGSLGIPSGPSSVKGQNFLDWSIAAMWLPEKEKPSSYAIGACPEDLTLVLDKLEYRPLSWVRRLSSQIRR